MSEPNVVTKFVFVFLFPFKSYSLCNLWCIGGQPSLQNVLPAHKALELVLHDTHLKNSLPYYTDFVHTGKIKSFHSHLLNVVGMVIEGGAEQTSVKSCYINDMKCEACRDLLKVNPRKKVLVSDMYCSKRPYYTDFVHTRKMESFQSSSDVLFEMLLLSLHRDLSWHGARIGSPSYTEYLLYSTGHKKGLN